VESVDASLKGLQYEYDGQEVSTVLRVTGISNISQSARSRPIQRHERPKVTGVGFGTGCRQRKDLHWSLHELCKMSLRGRFGHPDGYTFGQKMNSEFENAARYCIRPSNGVCVSIVLLFSHPVPISLRGTRLRYVAGDSALFYAEKSI
jgi:hypothetical protein